MVSRTPSEWLIAPSVRWSGRRPRVLAIINTTPDSFSDGGAYLSPDDAVRAAVADVSAGADGLDVGGESTRPGATRVEAAEQIRRIVPVIAAIRRELATGPVITVDTTLADVARSALDAGADAINDVSAATEDPGILTLAAERRCGLILMHRLAPPGRDVFSHQYTAPPDYSASGGVTGAVVAFLEARIAAARQAGVAHEAIVIDPGLGFGKTVEQNLELIRCTPVLCELGRPVLSGVSRKSFTAKAAGIDTARHPRERVHASVGLSVAHYFHGATIFRVHDVREHVEALRAAWAAIDQSFPGETPMA